MKGKNRAIKYNGWGMEYDPLLEKTYRAYKNPEDVKYAVGQAKITPGKVSTG